MEKLLQLVTILFVLSMVCERIAEFMKNYFSEWRVGSHQLIGNMVSKKTPESPEEQARTYRILKINLWCGFVTAGACHASLFDILSNLDNPSDALNWPTVWPDAWHMAGFIVGCFLTGAFISLGSKFWHDMLDLLLAVKNARRQTAGQESGKEFSMLSRSEQHEMAQSAIRDLSLDWRNNIKNYRGVSVAEKMKGQALAKASLGTLCISFHVLRKEDLSSLAPERIPDYILYNGYKIPTDVEPAGKAMNAASPIEKEVTPRPLGSSIERINSGYTGTLGFLVSSGGKYYGCSCYHVLFPLELLGGVLETKDGSQVGTSTVVSPSHKDSPALNHNIGNVVTGKFDKFLDVGFFETDPDKSRADVFELGAIQSLYHVSQQDINRLHVRFCGRTSGVVHDGVLESISAKPIVTYFENLGPSKQFNHEFQDYLRIRIRGAEGDSGAAVLTQDNRLIGLLVAVDTAFAYVLPVRFIENNFSYQIETLHP